VIAPRLLDHVALWVDDRDTLAGFLCDHLGMHVIERTDRFTLVGSDARRGKMTLFAADGPREQGSLRRVVLRVRDLEAALAALPAGVEVDRDGGVAAFAAPGGLGLGLVPGAADTVEYDIDHVVLGVPDPGATARALARFGFANDGGRPTVGDKHLRLEPGPGEASARPLLNHLALLVEEADAVERTARGGGLEVADVVDAPNTRAVFLWGPDRIKLEYVEHKPGFALV
jgi:catechol 2,3-dioxygenase-like lactoylglutathione lyase family enzyme